MKNTNNYLNLRTIMFVVLVFLFSVEIYAQKKTITGVVKDATTGETVIGASVIEKGTTNGVATNFDGKFKLDVPESATILIRYVGYKTQEISVKGKTFFDVSLQENTQMLKEVVAIGYGSQKKKEVTGSVASIKSEDFNAGVKTNPVGLVQGKVAGVNIIKTSSDPTSTGYNIQIRGFSTLDKGAGTSPLYIVDGIPVNNIDNISPDEIESMDVLKDGSAAAIYGTRGTNGVILITTKKGAEFSDKAKTQVEYSSYLSSSFRTGSSGMATPQEFRDLVKISGGVITPTIYDDGTGTKYNTDWMSELTRSVALTHNHNLAISGASKNFNYRASVNYKDAQGIAKVSNREEAIAKLTARQKALAGWLELQYDMSYMKYRNDYFTGSFKQAAIVNPTFPIYDKTQPSGYFKPQGTGLTNPVEDMNQRESYQDGNYFRGSIKATLNIKPVKGLKMNAFAALEEGDNYSYWANDVLNDEGSSGKAGRSNNSNVNKLFELTGDYVTSFGKHSVTSVAGFSYQNFFYDGENISNKGFPTNNVKYYQIGNGDATKKYLNVGSYRSSNSLAALFARANYKYAGKYLLSVSIRREGSSRFGENNKWGWFPAVSAGWRMSDEGFMDNVDWVKDLKWRVGFGVTGNNLASDLRSKALLGQGGTFWYNGQWVNTYSVQQNPNPDLMWEKKYEYNTGVDFSLLSDRLYGSFDVYYRQTRDLLWDYPVPTPPYQHPFLLANAGQMDSYGAELVLNAVPVKTKDWTWITTPTISFNRNYITKLSDPAKGFNYKVTTSGGVGENGLMNTNTQIIIEGDPVGAFYGYKFLGWQRKDGSNTLTKNYAESNGVWYFEGKNRKGEPVAKPGSKLKEKDKQILGNAQPLFTYGWNNVIKYKNFDATLFFRGVYGNKVLNLTRWAYGPDASQSLNVFMKDTKKGVITNKRYFSDYYLEDGSYLKLDNITVGYNVPLKNHKMIQSLRFYVTGQNLMTLTKYSGQDPEINTTSVWNSGIDYPDFYPTVSNFIVGFNITLL